MPLISTSSSRPNFVFRAEFRLQGRISSSGPNFVFRAEFRLCGRISSSRPNFVFRAEFRLQGRISSSGPNFVFRAEFRLQGRISSSGPNFVFRAEFRLQGRISSSRPNFVFAAEFRLQGRISSSRPNFVFRDQFRLQGPISSSGRNFVFRSRVLNAEDFRFRAEFRLQDDFRLRGRISSSARPKPNFVFTRISSSGPIFVFKYRLRAQFELQLLANNFVFKSFGISASGGDETGTRFPGSMHFSASCLLLRNSVRAAAGMLVPLRLWNLHAMLSALGISDTMSAMRGRPPSGECAACSSEPEQSDLQHFSRLGLRPFGPVGRLLPTVPRPAASIGLPLLLRHAMQYAEVACDFAGMEGLPPARWPHRPPLWAGAHQLMAGAFANWMLFLLEAASLGGHEEKHQQAKLHLARQLRTVGENPAQSALSTNIAEPLHLQLLCKVVWRFVIFTSLPERSIPQAMSCTVEKKNTGPGCNRSGSGVRCVARNGA